VPLPLRPAATTIAVRRRTRLDAASVGTFGILIFVGQFRDSATASPWPHFVPPLTIMTKTSRKPTPEDMFFKTSRISLRSILVMVGKDPDAVSLRRISRARSIVIIPPTFEPRLSTRIVAPAWSAAAVLGSNPQDPSGPSHWNASSYKRGVRSVTKSHCHGGADPTIWRKASRSVSDSAPRAVLAYEKGKRASTSAATWYVIAVAEATDVSLDWLVAGRWGSNRGATGTRSRSTAGRSCDLWEQRDGLTTVRGKGRRARAHRPSPRHLAGLSSFSRRVMTDRRRSGFG
jgi:hypothetical protein